MEELGSRLLWFAASRPDHAPLVFNVLQATWTAWSYRRARGPVASSSVLETLVGTLVLGFGGSTMSGKGRRPRPVSV